MCTNKYKVKFTKLDNNLYHRDYFKYVDCGRCFECIQKKKNQWAFRVNEESKISENALFLTLTYDNDNLPFYGVSIDDFQKFIKRVRRYLDYHNLSDKPLKYYCSSEYGTLFNRPHYHLILFNCPLSPDQLQKLWNKGFIKSVPSSIGCIQYVLKYFAIKQLHPYDKRKNFVVMSKNMGLNFVVDNPNYTKRYVLLNNYKVALPRYYVDKFNELDLKNGKKVRFPKCLPGDFNLSDMFSKKFLRSRNITKFDIDENFSLFDVDKLLSLQREYHLNDIRKIKYKYKNNKDNQ